MERQNLIQRLVERTLQSGNGRTACACVNSPKARPICICMASPADRSKRAASTVQK